jgi:hypothetical protein
MSKFFQTTRNKKVELAISLFGSVALLALVSATPAMAQGVPADLLRLDSSAVQGSQYGFFPDQGKQLHAIEQTQLNSRNSFALARGHARRTHHHQ